MGVRENKVETYLKDEVKRVFRGETRKWVSPGHDGVHDQILFISGLPAIFVEVKTFDGRLSRSQVREHNRLKRIKTTSIFITVYGQIDVDSLVLTLARRLGLEQHTNKIKIIENNVVVDCIKGKYSNLKCGCPSCMGDK